MCANLPGWIDIYVRHVPDCPQRANRLSRKCKCRKWFYISPDGRRVSAGTRSWEQAENKARQLLRDALNTTKAACVVGKSIRQAVSLYLEDKHQQALSTSREYKLTREMNELAGWSQKQGLLTLPELTLERLEQYRKTLGGAAITRSKRQERLRSFYLYCRKHRWVEDNVAADLSTCIAVSTDGLRTTSQPIFPRSRSRSPLLCLYRRSSSRQSWSGQRFTTRRLPTPNGGGRAIAMLLLLRWSGLRLGDAARLERSKLDKEGKIMLYMQKTGEGVYIALPPHVIEALRGLKNSNRKYFFWNGTSTIEGPVKRWWSTLSKIFTATGIEAHPHMLRDTFAVECLLAGLSLEEVSMLLGHGDIAITKKHYSPWVKARQAQLDESVKKSWPREN